jgi:hypothetical protein
LVYHWCQQHCDAYIADVADTGEACITGISNATKLVIFSGLLLASINDTGDHDVSGVNNTSKEYITIVIDNGEMCSPAHCISNLIYAEFSP